MPKSKRKRVKHEPTDAENALAFWVYITSESHSTTLAQSESLVCHPAVAYILGFAFEEWLSAGQAA